MTDFEQYKEHIEHTFNAYCKIVIRHAAINMARRRHKQQEREISLDYLTAEKHVPFVTLDNYFIEPERTIEHPCAIGKDTVMLNSSLLADVLSRLRSAIVEWSICGFLRTAPTKKSANGTGGTGVLSAYIFARLCGNYNRKWRTTKWERKNRKLLPYEIIVKAANGEAEAVETVLAHYAGYIRYASLVGGKVHVDTEDEVKTKLLESLFKFHFDRWHPQLNITLWSVVVTHDCNAFLHSKIEKQTHIPCHFAQIFAFLRENQKFFPETSAIFHFQVL